MKRPIFKHLFFYNVCVLDVIKKRRKKCLKKVLLRKKKIESKIKYSCRQYKNLSETEKDCKES